MRSGQKHHLPLPGGGPAGGAERATDTTAVSQRATSASGLPVCPLCPRSERRERRPACGHPSGQAATRTTRAAAGLAPPLPPGVPSRELPAQGEPPMKAARLRRSNGATQHQKGGWNTISQRLCRRRQYLNGCKPCEATTRCNRTHFKTDTSKLLRC